MAIAMELFTVDPKCAVYDIDGTPVDCVSIETFGKPCNGPWHHLIEFSKKFNHPYTCGLLCQAIAAWDSRFIPVLCLYKNNFHVYLRCGRTIIDPTYGQFLYGRDVSDNELCKIHNDPSEYQPDPKYDGKYEPTPIFYRCKYLANGNFLSYLDNLSK